VIEYYIVDVESTGLKAGWHEINQISIIRVSDQFQRTINIAVDHPERASPEALNIQKKSRADLTIGIPKEQAVEELIEFFEEDEKTPAHRCVVAHNGAFDRRFLHALWDSMNQPFPADLWLCTKAFTQKYAKKVGVQKIASIQGVPKAKFTLAHCLLACGIKAKFGAHSATIDTQNTLSLYEFLMGENLDYVSIIKRLPHRSDDDL
jgi:DNA polymerase III epsilon subunit-like protein